MKKTHKVIMLPTEKASIYLHQGKLYNNKTTMHIPDGKQIPQHLYILSSETIQEGDWYIDSLVHPNLITEPLQMKGWCSKKNQIIQSTVGTTSPVSTSKKVIATTDILFTSTKDMVNPYVLQIPPSFLPIFVEAYNEANIGGVSVTSLEVELEYNSMYVKGNYQNKCSLCGELFMNTDKLGFVCSKHDELKTTKSNEVIISLPLTLDNTQLASEQFSIEIERNKNVKIYSREEILERLSYNKLRTRFNSKSGMFLNKKTTAAIIEWIEENLK